MKHLDESSTAKLGNSPHKDTRPSRSLADYMELVDRRMRIGLVATVPDLRRRRQNDDAARANLVYNLTVALRDLTDRSQVRPLGFDPATASQVSRPVAIRPTNLNSAFRLRRSGTAETSLVSNLVTDLVTDLVTGHTRQRPSPNGKGPLTCDDVGSGGRI